MLYVTCIFENKFCFVHNFDDQDVNYDLVNGRGPM